jgi:hypothetical protein
MSEVYLQRRRQIQRHIAMTLEACPLFHTAHTSNPDGAVDLEPRGSGSEEEEDTPARWGMPTELGQGNYVRLPYGNRAMYLEVVSISALRENSGVKKALAVTRNSKATVRANAALLQEILDGTVIAS